MDINVIPRCSDCAFVNPDDALHCGMCGSLLAEAWPSYEKQSKKKKTYDKSIIEGGIYKATAYGYQVWGREVWRFIGIGIPPLVVLAIVFGLVGIFEGSRLSAIVWLTFILLLLIRGGIVCE